MEGERNDGEGERKGGRERWLGLWKRKGMMVKGREREGTVATVNEV